jgi:2-dehydropantoate 2-reductase
MRIAVIGAGSMGTVFGGNLAQAGEDVTLVDRSPEIVSALQAIGVRVRHPGGEFTAAVKATASVGEAAPADLVIVFVDGGSTAEVASQIPGILAPEGYAVTLQNGIGNVEALVDQLGHERVMGGSTYVSASMIAPGHAHNTNIGQTVIGEIKGGVSSRATKLAALLSSCGLPCIADGNVMGHIWSKFALNCALNPLSALTGLRPGEVARHQPMSKLLDTVIAEILSVISAKGIALPEADMRAHIIEHAFLRYNRPSMLQHVEAGSRTEIGSLNGALVREAERIGVDVPANRVIAALVEAVDARNMRGETIDEVGLEARAATEFATLKATFHNSAYNGDQG